MISKKLTKNKIEILDIFRKNIFLEITIRRIMKELKKKSYQRVYEGVKGLEHEDILNIRTIGKSSLVSLSLNQKSISILAFFDEQEALSKKIPNIHKILDFKEFFEDIVIVTGSYAKGIQTKKSDIDLVIITKEDAFNKQKLLENLTKLMLPEMHSVVITHKDFINMLLSREENYGKEIYKHKFIFRNANRYYVLLKEAIENGFRG